MQLKEILSKTKLEFDGVLDFYHKDISMIRTGRATPSLVEDIVVDLYGQKMRIKELATITTPEPRSLSIQPWDKNAIQAISGAISRSELSINPIVNGPAIILNIPPLTEERRKEFVKLLKTKSEDARIKLRKHREDAWHNVQAGEKDGEIREDEKFKAKDDLQKLVDDCNKKIEELEKKKEEELMNA
ncbi:MAG: ribosome recycling factor [bacterium]|nr:ribosome recycling factor [bacterium]